MTGKNSRSWCDIAPADAVDITLPYPGIDGPHGEDGQPCPWPWEPQQFSGAPIGQYRCSYCGSMVLAGAAHIDYRSDGSTGGLRAELRSAEPALPQQFLRKSTSAAVDAIQLHDDPDHVASVAAWITSSGGEVDEPFLPDADHVLCVRSGTERRWARLGDWIVRDGRRIVAMERTEFESLHTPLVAGSRDEPPL
ncbi:hypothetical protein [Nocardia puris]|uniref:Uncharacterized protein n=1 Tax=Nocardia puris TaxID=208602 RepID=A0A366DMT7_9NOCA|nr:hypothetical protein [Nocardia puris]RBO91366.1 hypothetical protein DFR74_10468 [Nocardia puris]